MYLALRKCKKDCKILKTTLVQIFFCPLKPEIARFSIGFRLKYVAYIEFFLESLISNMEGLVML